MTDKRISIKKSKSSKKTYVYRGRIENNYQSYDIWEIEGVRRDRVTSRKIYVPVSKDDPNPKFPPSDLI